MVEQPQEESQPSPEDVAAALEVEEQLSKEHGEEKGQGDFDPFKPIPQPAPEAPRAPIVTPPPQSFDPPAPRQPPPPSPQPQPVMTMPAALPANLRRPMPAGHQAKESSPEHPHVSTPSVQNEVVERPAERPVRPKIDQMQGNRNPRFSPPR